MLRRLSSVVERTLHTRDVTSSNLVVGILFRISYAREKRGMTRKKKMF